MIQMTSETPPAPDAGVATGHARTATTRTDAGENDRVAERASPAGD
jgi:hypothetical protein